MLLFSQVVHTKGCLPTLIDGLFHMDEYICLYWDICSCLCTFAHVSLEYCKIGFGCPIFLPACDIASIIPNGDTSSRSISNQFRAELSPPQCLAILYTSKAVLYSATLGRANPLLFLVVYHFSSFIRDFLPFHRKSLIILLYCLKKESGTVNGTIMDM